MIRPKKDKNVTIARGKLLQLGIAFPPNYDTMYGDTMRDCAQKNGNEYTVESFSYVGK